MIKFKLEKLDKNSSYNKITKKIYKDYQIVINIYYHLA